MILVKRAIQPQNTWEFVWYSLQLYKCDIFFFFKNRSGSMFRNPSQVHFEIHSDVGLICSRSRIKQHESFKPSTERLRLWQVQLRIWKCFYSPACRFDYSDAQPMADAMVLYLTVVHFGSYHHLVSLEVVSVLCWQVYFIFIFLWCVGMKRRENAIN